MGTEADFTALVTALERTWAGWLRFGQQLGAAQWRHASRCAGWDVRALYAHHGAFPVALAAPPSVAGTGEWETITAAELLRRFNEPGGVAHTLAPVVADRAVQLAASRGPEGLLDPFVRPASQAVAWLRRAEPSTLLPWPASGARLPLCEAVRIVVLEATVHLLDVLDAVPEVSASSEATPAGAGSAVPAEALRATAQLLADLAPAVPLIEAATGRREQSPFPVLR